MRRSFAGFSAGRFPNSNLKAVEVWRFRSTVSSSLLTKYDKFLAMSPPPSLTTTQSRVRAMEFSPSAVGTELFGPASTTC